MAEDIADQLFPDGKDNYTVEEQFQADCAQWFWNKFPEERRMLFQVQQNAQNAVVGARHKATGVVRGPSDLVLVGNHRTFFIELKLKGREQLKEQKDFMVKVRARGHKYTVIEPPLRNFKEFVAGALNL